MSMKPVKIYINFKFKVLSCILPISALFLSGCGGGGVSGSNPNPNPNPVPTPQRQSSVTVPFLWNTPPAVNPQLVDPRAQGAGIILSATRQDDPTGSHYVLMGRRIGNPGNGEYCFPGGKVDPGENYLQAAIRECLEETGGLCGSDAVKNIKGTEAEISTQDLQQMPVAVTQSANGTHVNMYFFVGLKNPVSSTFMGARHILSAVNRTSNIPQGQPGYLKKEMDRYIWVPVSVLKQKMLALSQQYALNTPNWRNLHETLTWTSTSGTQENITLWWPVLRSLTTAPGINLLNVLPN